MKKKFTKQDIEFTLFADFWSILQEYYIPEHTDEYWDALNNSLDRFIGKYRKNRLARLLANMLITFLEEKSNNAEEIQKNK